MALIYSFILHPIYFSFLVGGSERERKRGREGERGREGVGRINLRGLNSCPGIYCRAFYTAILCTTNFCHQSLSCFPYQPTSTYLPPPLPLLLSSSPLLSSPPILYPPLTPTFSLTSPFLFFY